MYENDKRKIELLEQSARNLRAQAKRENRHLLPVEGQLLKDIDAEVEKIKMSLPEKPLTVQGSRKSDHGIEDGTTPTLRGPNDKKDYRSLFGRGNEIPWNDSSQNFFQAVFSKRYHPGLIQNATMTEAIPSDGGFLVPTQLVDSIHAVSLENEIVMPRCYVQPMTTKECSIPGMDIGDHSSNLYGGFTASYTDELGTISEANPKTRLINLNAKKLTGLVRLSNELVNDMIGGLNKITNICGKGLAWYRDRAFLKGTGAGEPLGILNADCTIEIDKEAGQVADTIMYENLCNMLGRLHPGSFKNSVWVAHVTTVPQLLQLTIPVGLGGVTYPALSESIGVFKLLTRPVIFSEKTEPLGDKGDLMLCDFSQYVVGLRQGMRFDLSPHVYFTTDELLARLIERHDGMPTWNEALTLEDGSTTVSPFVVLAERA